MNDDVILEVQAGACQFKTVVIGSLCEDGHVDLRIKSECPMVRKMAARMPEFDPVDAASMRLHENPVIVHAGNHLSHPACPVPVAIIKVLESSSGMAVKKDVTMHYCPSSR